MKTVWKFPLGPGDQKVPMPENAKVIHVAVQGNQPCLWAVVDSDMPLQYRRIVVIGTGHDMPEGEGNLDHLGSFFLHGGALVFHVFEVLP